MKDEFRKIEGDHGLMPCPFCGHKAELWEIDRGDDFVKVAMCTNTDDNNQGEDCPMYMPSHGFEKATKREAIAQWNKRA
jgi:hypothetical protein